MKDKFIKRLSLNKKSKSTMKSILFAINHYSSFLSNKPLENSTEDDILEYIQHLREEGNAESSISLYKSKLRQFFTFCDEELEDKKYRKFVKLLKGQIKSKKLTPEDILSVEEIKRLIIVATSEQDRAIVSILYESGMRIGEFVALNRSNVKIIEKDMIISIPNLEGCKTGSRTIPCVELSGHAAITRSAMMEMTDVKMSYRYWGSAHSDMLDIYIHLSEEMKSDSYKRLMDIKTEESKIKNSIASLCVECGKQIPSGNLCDTCNSIKKISEENERLKAKVQFLENIEKERELKNQTYKNFFDKEIEAMNSLIKHAELEKLTYNKQTKNPTNVLQKKEPENK